MTSTDGAIRLRRGVGARLAGGAVPFLQTVLTLGVVVWVAMIGMVVGLADAGVNEVLAAAAPGLPVVVLWLVGVTARAQVDDGGLRWRYYRSCAVGWADVERVLLESRLVGAAAGEPVVRVVVGGHRRLVSPASQCRWPALIEFGIAVADRAAAHGVEVVVDRRDGRWDPVLDRPVR